MVPGFGNQQQDGDGSYDRTEAGNLPVAEGCRLDGGASGGEKECRPGDFKLVFKMRLRRESYFP
jgi:hypothetical protein